MTMMTTVTEPTIPIPAIALGTVIDHITAGQGLAIIRLLRLDHIDQVVSIALNLPSSSMGRKDLIKVTGKHFSREEMSQIALLSPQATINIVDDYSVTDKFRVTPPKEVEGLIKCPNTQCITHVEPVAGRFCLTTRGHRGFLTCSYCSYLLPLGDVKRYCL